MEGVMLWLDEYDCAILMRLLHIESNRLASFRESHVFSVMGERGRAVAQLEQDRVDSLIKRLENAE